jgi:hypothetical protein
MVVREILAYCHNLREEVMHALAPRVGLFLASNFIFRVRSALADATLNTLRRLVSNAARGWVARMSQEGQKYFLNEEEKKVSDRPGNETDSDSLARIGGTKTNCKSPKSVACEKWIEGASVDHMVECDT